MIIVLCKVYMCEDLHCMYNLLSYLINKICKQQQHVFKYKCKLRNKIVLGNLIFLPLGVILHI